ncbi:ABC transporter ATP-binding protein, partial [Methylobacterium brachythecii]
TLARAEAAMAYARAPALALIVLLPAIFVATALWRGPGMSEGAAPIMPGALAAAGAAFTLAAALVAAFLRLWFLRMETAPTYRRLAQTFDGLADKRPALHRAAAFPASGALIATEAGAYDPASGERLTGLDADLPMPAHVAIVGERGSGVQALAALLAGQIEPSVGTITYGGLDLRSLDPAERAHRIAFAGSEAILIEGTLKQNLLYGARTDEREALGEQGRIALLKLSGLDALIYSRGLEGTIDPDDEPAVAQAVVAARSAVREMLATQGMARLVEAFDPARYNHQATVGENILFGEAVGPTFSEERLARQPYLRAVLEAEGLTRSFVEMGLAIARATVEIFSELPDDHPLFDAFSLFPAQERGFFEDLIARQPNGGSLRRGPAGARDRERLIGLALRYSETRHRFGLVDPELEQRIVAARISFARLMPAKFRDKIDLYDPARVTAAASFEENVLFGRITQGEANAEQRVRALVRQVLADQGLEPTVYRLGLASRVASSGPGTAMARRQGLTEGGIGPRERVAIDLVRCLVRRPDILVVGLLPDERKSEEIAARIMRLRMIRQGMGLIVCLPDAATLGRLPPFDAVLTVARNAATLSGTDSAEEAAPSHAA